MRLSICRVGELRQSAMESASQYILLLAQCPHRLPPLAALLGCSNYSISLACSEEQALVRASEHRPFLIILAGDHQHWSRHLVRRLKIYTRNYPITLVALTDFHAPSWVHQEENPGFDGFLVSPISSEVLFSLVQSAYTRQIFCSAN
jgi:AmiR/NasT family two-component response regulator